MTSTLGEDDLRERLGVLVHEVSLTLDSQPPVRPSADRPLLPRERGRRRTRRRVVVAAVGVAAVAGAAVAAFRIAGDPAERTGLERYNPAAITAVGPDLPDSNAQVAVVMENRYVCQVLHRYVEAGQPGSAAAVAELTDDLQASEARLLEFASGPGEGQAANDAFVELALTSVGRSLADGSVAPVQELIGSECDPNQDYAIPILRGDP